MGDARSPDALLLLGTTCPNCPTALQALSNMIKQGKLGSLRIVNLEQRLDIAAEFNVRSVPWVRIGDFELSGLRSAAEYGEWADRARLAEHDSEQLLALLAAGEALNAAHMVRHSPKLLSFLLQLLSNDREKLNIRLGIGVVMEELAGSESLADAIEELGALSQHPAAAVRADACHYLGLSGSTSARTWLHTRLDDSDSTVRDIATESLELLADN